MSKLTHCGVFFSYLLQIADFGYEISHDFIQKWARELHSYIIVV